YFNPEGSALLIMDAATGKQLQDINSGFDMVFGAAISGDNKLMAVSGGKDDKGLIVVYDVATGKERRRMALAAAVSDQLIPVAEPGDGPSLLLFGPDNRTLAAPLGAEKVLLWDVTTGRELPAIHLREDQVAHAIAFAPDSRSIVLDCGDGAPRLY